MLDLTATVAGVRLPFCALNVAGTYATAEALRALAASRSGAVVLQSATVHPFVHPEFRSLHNPGFDKLIPLATELAAAGERPVIASVAGGTPGEYVLLARAFAEAGAACIEANLADPWVTASLGPFEDPSVLREISTGLVAATAVPVWIKLPDRVPLPYGRVVEELAAAGVRAIAVKNDFVGFERLLLEAGTTFDIVAVGGIRSGYDVSRALAKGAKAVQVSSAFGFEGPAVFARLEREMRIAWGGRQSS